MALAHACVWTEDDLESFLSYFSASEIWLKAARDLQRMDTIGKSYEKITELALAAQHEQINEEKKAKDISAAFKVTLEHRKQRDTLRQEQKANAEERERKERSNLMEQSNCRAELESELKDILSELSLRKISDEKLASKMSHMSIGKSNSKIVIEDVNYDKTLDSMKFPPDSSSIYAVCNAPAHDIPTEDTLTEIALSLLWGSRSHLKSALPEKAVNPIDVEIFQTASKSGDGRTEVKQTKKPESDRNLTEYESNKQQKRISSSFGSIHKTINDFKADDSQKLNFRDEIRNIENIAQPLKNRQNGVRNGESKNPQNWGKKRRRKAHQQANEEKNFISAEHRRQFKSYANINNYVSYDEDINFLTKKANGGKRRRKN